MSGKYGSKTIHSSKAQYRHFASGEIEEAIAYYKSEGAIVNSIPIWKDQYGNQYTLIQITDRHLGNLIPFLRKRIDGGGIHGNRRTMDMLHMMEIEQRRRQETVNNIDYIREQMQNQLEL